MNVKRALVWTISAVFGVVTTAGIIFPSIPLGPITIGFGTSLEKFQTWNVILLFLSMAAIAFIWLDYILKTDYLKR